MTALCLFSSSPSGAGKTTIIKKIQQKYQDFKISVSHTTRKPRPNEIDGVDYHFVSEEEFEKLIKNNEFYEHAKILAIIMELQEKSIKVLQEKIIIFCLILIGRALNN